MRRGISLRLKRGVAALFGAAMVVAAIGAAGVAGAAGSGTDPQTGRSVGSYKAAVCEYPINASNAAVQDKVVTSSDPRYHYNNAAWANMECGAVRVTIPGGKTAGIIVQVDAEVTCTGPVPDTSEWCQGRVLIGGAEGYPREPEATGSFTWVASDTDAADWESNAFTRSFTIRCTTTASCTVPVQVQVKNHAANHELRVDGSTVYAHATFY